MTIEILSTREDPEQEKWFRGECACGTTFRLQRKDFNYDRRFAAWVNCPSHCGRTITSGWKAE